MKYLLMTLTLLALTSNALAEAKITNLELREVFVVPEGYDTNDNIEVTFLTQLPNTCYTPHKSVITKTSETSYKVDFFIKQKNLSSCQNTSSTTIKNPIYYSQTLSLGELAAGQYNIEYSKEGKVFQKDFMVVNARTTSMDDILYAPVSNAFIPEMIYTSADVQIILSGILQTSCMSISDKDIDVKKFDNVYVIIPKARINPFVVCRPIEIPLQKIVSLGEIKKTGAYLIHVRSLSGISVNKVFQVRKKNYNQRGR